MAATVVITASAGSFPGLANALGELSVVVEERPLLRFAPPLDWTPVDLAIDRCVRPAGGASYAALVFTSPRAAQAFAERVRARGSERFAVDAAGPEVWAAGAGTARPLAGIAPDVRLPDERAVGRLGAAAALLEALIATGTARRGPILFPSGDRRREELVDGLRRVGAVVDEICCYRSVLADEQAARDAAAGASLLVVASPSVADLLARACVGPRPALLAVGPTTAAASRAAGWMPVAVAEQPTVAAIGDTIRTFFR